MGTELAGKPFVWLDFASLEAPRGASPGLELGALGADQGVLAGTVALDAQWPHHFALLRVENAAS